MSGGYPEPLLRLMEALTRLPGIGERTAERLAFHMLKQKPQDVQDLISSISDATGSVRHCKQCHNLTQAELCGICSDEDRNQNLLCVVESPRDLVAIERTATFQGLYHCLLGRISPVEGINEESLTIDSLLERATKGQTTEIILATNPNLEGDATALAVARALSESKVKVTRLARGVPVGHQLEYLAGSVMQEAFEGRQPILSKGGVL